MKTLHHRQSTSRPFSVHDTRGTILPALRVRKLNTEMNVGLVAGQEVFGRHAYGITSQQYLAGTLTVTTLANNSGLPRIRPSRSNQCHAVLGMRSVALGGQCGIRARWALLSECSYRTIAVTGPHWEAVRAPCISLFRFRALIMASATPVAYMPSKKHLNVCETWCLTTPAIVLRGRKWPTR